MTVFRVWAPEAARAEVDISGHRHPMMATAQPGWWQAEVAATGDGTDYAFRLDGGRTAPPGHLGAHGLCELPVVSSVVNWEL